MNLEVPPEVNDDAGDSSSIGSPVPGDGDVVFSKLDDIADEFVEEGVSETSSPPSLSQLDLCPPHGGDNAYHNRGETRGYEEADLEVMATAAAAAATVTKTAGGVEQIWHEKEIIEVRNTSLRNMSGR